MIRIAFIASVAVAALSLAGCGADGEPVRPSLNAGVGISSSGVHLGGNVGLRKGPVRVSIGL